MAISTKFFLFNKNKSLGGFRGAILSSGSSVISFEVRHLCESSPITVYINPNDGQLGVGVVVYTDDELTIPYANSSLIYLSSRFEVDSETGNIINEETPFACAVSLEVFGECEQFTPFTVYGDFQEGVPNEFTEGTMLYDDANKVSSNFIPNEFIFEGIIYNFSSGTGTQLIGPCGGGEG